MSAVYAQVSNRGTVDLPSDQTKLSFCHGARKTSSLFIGIGCRVCLLAFIKMVLIVFLYRVMNGRGLNTAGKKKVIAQ